MFTPAGFGAHWRRLMQGFLDEADALGAMLVKTEDLAGGTLRDVLLERRPFFWVQHAHWLWVLLALCIVAMLFMCARHFAPTERAIQGYANYAKALPACTHALCWAHARRAFLKAESIDPQPVAQALEMIRALYAIERQLRALGASEATILARRTQDSTPIVDRFFVWVAEQIAQPGLLPRSALARALAYAKEREPGLREFLRDAWLALDTNDLERALRVIPMGRRNWLFCTTEFGARQVATIQTLLATCRAHGIDAYTYLVDVLQRVNQHPASRVAELTPRLWAQHFGHDPLRSDLARCQ